MMLNIVIPHDPASWQQHDLIGYGREVFTMCARRRPIMRPPEAVGGAAQTRSYRKFGMRLSFGGYGQPPQSNLGSHRRQLRSIARWKERGLEVDVKRHANAITAYRRAVTSDQAIAGYRSSGQWACPSEKRPCTASWSHISISVTPCAWHTHHMMVGGKLQGIELLHGHIIVQIGVNTRPNHPASSTYGTTLVSLLRKHQTRTLR